MGAGSVCTQRHRDECCPDFSCCEPKLLASYETRRKFADSSEDQRLAMLGMFLGKAMNEAVSQKGVDPESVYLSGSAQAVN